MAKRLLARKRILIVDDDEPYAGELNQALTQCGAEVECAPTGEEAILLLKEQKSPFNIAIIDIRFKKGGNGFEIAYDLRRMMKKSFPRQQFKTVCLSSFHDDFSDNRYKKHFDAAFPKNHNPSDPDWMPKKLASLLGNRTLLPVRPSPDEQTHLPQKPVGSWWKTALLAGGVAAISTLVLILLPSNWLVLKIAYVVGLFVAIVVWLRDPQKRYYRGFLVAFLLFASANTVPALGLEITRSDFIFQFFSRGPGTSFNVVLGAIIIALLFLDSRERRE